MDDKYLPPLDERVIILSEQIGECKRIIFRNLTENLTFIENNEKAKIKEVEYNNQTLKEKIDLLSTELESLTNETGSDSTE